MNDGLVRGGSAAQADDSVERSWRRSGCEGSLTVYVNGPEVLPAYCANSLLGPVDATSGASGPIGNGCRPTYGKLLRVVDALQRVHHEVPEPAHVGSPATWVVQSSGAGDRKPATVMPRVTVPVSSTSGGTRRTVEGLVCPPRSCPEELDVRVPVGQERRDRVVVAGVAVEQNRGRHGPSSARDSARWMPERPVRRRGLSGSLSG